MTKRHLQLIAILLGIAVLLYLPRIFGGEEGRGSVAVEDGFSVQLSSPVTRVDVLPLESGDTISLERAEGTWMVGAFEADTAKIRTLLEVIDDLGSTELVARNPSNHERLGVSDSNGRRVEIYTEAGGPTVFHLGNRDLAAGGYFVRHPGADAVFRLDSPAGGYFSRERDGWRERVIARVDVETVRDVVIRRGGDTTVVRLEDGTWAVNGGPADSAAVQSMLGLLSSLSTSGFPTDEQAAATDFSMPEAELDVFAEGGGGVTDRQLALGLRLVRNPDAGDWLVRRLDGSEVYRLAAFTVRQLLPERSVLLPEEEEEEEEDGGPDG